MLKLNHIYEVFIFNWNHNEKNTIWYENIFNQYKIPVTVINSSPYFQKDNWINLGDSAYFSKQWNTLLENKNDVSDFVFHIQSDAYFGSPIKFINDMDALVSEYSGKIGIYAPNVDFTHHRYDLTQCKLFKKNIYEVVNTDCTYWAISNKLLNSKKELYDINTNYIGYGADWYYAALSNLNNMYVLRNYEYDVNHKCSTGYDSEIASHQFLLWLEEQSEDVKNQIKINYGIREQILI